MDMDSGTRFYDSRFWEEGLKKRKKELSYLEKNTGAGEWSGEEGLMVLSFGRKGLRREVLGGRVESNKNKNSQGT